MNPTLQMENLRLRRFGGLSRATHTLHPCFAPTRPDTSQNRECGAFGALSGKWGFSEAGTEDDRRRKVEPGLNCGLLRPGFWKGPEDSQGCFLLDCWVCPTWRLLQGVRDTVTEELVREGSWAWFFIPVRQGWQRTWRSTHSQDVRHRWAEAQPS